MIATLSPYIPIAVGVALGASAYFGSRMLGGEPLQWSHSLGFVLQLGLVGAIAAWLIETSGVGSPTGKVVVSGVLAVSAQSVIEWAKDGGWRRLLNVAAPEKRND